MNSLQLKPLALSFVFFGAAAGAAETAVVETAAVQIIGTTPLAGVGVPREQIPANVQSLGGARFEASAALHLGEFMARQLPSVTLNEVQGNPLQPDLNYRGFSASPLLGTAQGLSVYVDGVRVNEPFGDTVNWDLLPHAAVAGIDLIPGSNPASTPWAARWRYAARAATAIRARASRPPPARSAARRPRSSMAAATGRAAWLGTSPPMPSARTAGATSRRRAPASCSPSSRSAARRPTTTWR